MKKRRKGESWLSLLDYLLPYRSISSYGTLLPISQGRYGTSLPRFQGPRGLGFSTKSAIFELKGGSNEIFAHFSVFSKVIFIIYQKILFGDRVPLTELNLALLSFNPSYMWLLASNMWLLATNMWLLASNMWLLAQTRKSTKKVLFDGLNNRSAQYQHLNDS